MKNLIPEHKLLIAKLYIYVFIFNNKRDINGFFNSLINHGYWVKIYVDGYHFCFENGKVENINLHSHNEDCGDFEECTINEKLFNSIKRISLESYINDEFEFDIDINELGLLEYIFKYYKRTFRTLS